MKKEMTEETKQMRRLINEMENFDATQYQEKLNQQKSDNAEFPNEEKKPDITITFTYDEIGGLLEALASTNIENNIQKTTKGFQSPMGEKYHNYQKAAFKIKHQYDKSNNPDTYDPEKNPDYYENPE